MSLDLSGNVAVPGLGELKKSYVAVALAGTAGFIGFAYLRRARDGASADPAAGEEPTATEGDYNAGTEPYGGAYPDAIDSYSNPAPAVVNTYTPPDPDTMPPTTNAAWSSRAVDRLAEVGYDPKAVASALGRYLSRTPQKNWTGVEIVRTSLAMVGPPPLGLYPILNPVPATAASPSSGATTTKPTTSSTTRPASSSSTTTKPKTGVRVTVRRWTKTNPPWQSTIQGIAGHYHTSTRAIWDDPHNKAIRAKRRLASHLQPGDVVYVVPK